MDSGFVELEWENDEIVKRRRPSTFMLSQRSGNSITASAAAGDYNHNSSSQGHTLSKTGSLRTHTTNNYYYQDNHQPNTPTRNVFELFSSPNKQCNKLLASNGGDDRHRASSQVLLKDYLNKSSSTFQDEHGRDLQPPTKTVNNKRPVQPAHDNSMCLVPDDHDDRQNPTLDQPHQAYYDYDYPQNQEDAALVPSLNSVGASNDHHDHHLPVMHNGRRHHSTTITTTTTTLDQDVDEDEDEDDDRDHDQEQEPQNSLSRKRSAKLHNLSERRRRDKINKRIRTLKALIPNCNKVDKASILDDAIDHLKTLQFQLQMMSMGAGLNVMNPMMAQYLMSCFSPMAMAPLVASRLGVQMFGFPAVSSSVSQSSQPSASFMPWHVPAPPSSQMPRFQAPMNYYYSPQNN